MLKRILLSLSPFAEACRLEVTVAARTAPAPLPEAAMRLGYNPVGPQFRPIFGPQLARESMDRDWLAG